MTHSHMSLLWGWIADKGHTLMQGTPCSSHYIVLQACSYRWRILPPTLYAITSTFPICQSYPTCQHEPLYHIWQYKVPSFKPLHHIVSMFTQAPLIQATTSCCKYVHTEDSHLYVMPYDYIHITHLLTLPCMLAWTRSHLVHPGWGTWYVSFHHTLPCAGNLCQHEHITLFTSRIMRDT